MEQTEIKEQPSEATEDIKAQSVSKAQNRGEVSPQICSRSRGSAAGCNGGMPARAGTSYVYAIGKIECRFPTISVEKEFAQASGRGDTKGLTDQKMMYSILSKKENRYIARQMCWVMTIEGLEVYILIPRDPVDLDMLIESIRPEPTREDVDVVIGIRGPVASPDMCNGLMIPIVGFDQIYSFDIDSLIKSIPRPEKIGGEEFEPAARELLERILQMADNAGSADEHRALNYLAMRYKGIYSMAADQFSKNASLTSVDVRPSALSGARNIVEVVFTFTNRQTDVEEKFSVRVDVTEEFPFLVTKLSPYFIW